MKFHKQEKPGTCHLVAIETLLSHFDINISRTEIKKELPKHTFGNFITEIGIFFESLGLNTKLYSNMQSFASNNKPFLESLSKYQKVGKFIDSIPNSEILNNKPVLVNVDWYKIGPQKGKPDGHYIVLLNQEDSLWLYDGGNYKRRVRRTFKDVLEASKHINRYKENGMWLVIE